MAARFDFTSLVPPGLKLERVDEGEDTLVVTARSNAVAASCPPCGTTSRRVQSHYVRRPSGLPCAGRRVRLRLLVRRFRCGEPGCQRQVFAERFGTTVLAERAQRTGRLGQVGHHPGLALGGRPGAGLAQRLMLPVSNAAGCHNDAELWRRLKDQGFPGSLRVVTERATRRRRAEQMQAQGVQKAPSARTLARLLTMGRDHLSKADTMTVAAVETGVPGLTEARGLVERFMAMIRTKAATELDGWIEQAKVNLIAPLARGVAKGSVAIFKSGRAGGDACVSGLIRPPWVRGGC